MSTPEKIWKWRTANRLLWPALQTLDWQPLVGRHYAIRVIDLGLSLRFTVTQRGFAHDSGEPDLTIGATARDFLLLLSRREDPDTLFFSRRLVSEGDTELGLIVKNLLDAIEHRDGAASLAIASCAGGAAADGGVSLTHAPQAGD